jgi:hypothetical protein
MRIWLVGIGLLGMLIGVQSSIQSQEKKQRPPVYTDAKEAGPDFAIQGDYMGEVQHGDKSTIFGAQVVALGKGKFRVKFLKGGLPGDGWNGKDVLFGDAETKDGKTTLAGKVKNKEGEIKEYQGTIADGRIAGEVGTEAKFSLKQVFRKSKTEGAKPPTGAIILFDGTNADEWQGGKLVEGNLLNNGISTKRKFKDYKAHIEFRLPFMPESRGQGRGNSGFYFLQSMYELQILDSFGLKGENNECGGIYTIKAPSVNMCYPPLSWQTYDVDYKAARFDEDGKKVIAHPVVTVYHNGVKIHDQLEIPFCTEDHKRKITTNAGTIHLQNHGDPVVFRNIWLVEKKGD